MISKELMYKSCLDMGINIDSDAVDRFDKYAELLTDYNNKVNLTAITAPDDIVIKHFTDSLCLSKYVELDGKKIKYTEYVYIMLNKPGGVVSAT